jgi:hypothetical protein
MKSHKDFDVWRLAMRLASDALAKQELAARRSPTFTTFTVFTAFTTFHEVHP